MLEVVKMFFVRLLPRTFWGVNVLVWLTGLAGLMLSYLVLISLVLITLSAQASTEINVFLTPEIWVQLDMVNYLTGGVVLMIPLVEVLLSSIQAVPNRNSTLKGGDRKMVAGLLEGVGLSTVGYAFTSGAPFIAGFSRRGFWRIPTINISERFKRLPEDIQLFTLVHEHAHSKMWFPKLRTSLIPFIIPLVLMGVIGGDFDPAILVVVCLLLVYVVLARSLTGIQSQLVEFAADGYAAQVMLQNGMGLPYNSIRELLGQEHRSLERVSSGLLLGVVVLLLAFTMIGVGFLDGLAQFLVYIAFVCGCIQVPTLAIRAHPRPSYRLEHMQCIAKHKQT